MIDEALFAPRYCDDNGRPNRTVQTVFGVLLLKEMYNLTDVEALEQREFGLLWQHALQLTPEEAHRDGKPYKDIRVSANQAAQKAGIKGPIQMHQLRHAFCSHALMQGIDVRSVQRWMGHKDLRTTLRYAHISPDHERAAIQRLRYDHGHQVDTRRSVKQQTRAQIDPAEIGLSPCFYCWCRRGDSNPHGVSPTGF